MRFERLGEKITQIRGISYKPNDISSVPLPEYVPILKANNIQEDGIVIKDLIYIHKSKVRPEQFIKKGDLLLAASSGSKDIVGKNIYFESDFNGSFGAFCKLVRPNENIKPRYLATFFKSVPYKRHIRKLLSGALINNLKNEYIDSLLIPEISDTDQHHIANLLSKAETLITQRKETLRLLNEYLKSTFLEMFGDPVKNEKKWDVYKFGDLINVKHGFAFSSEYFAANGDYVLLTPGNYFEEGGYKDRGEKQKYYVGDFPNDYLLKKGDLLIAMTEQAAGLLGSTIIIPKSNKFLHNQRLGLVQFDSNKLVTHFLYFLFNFNSIRFLIHAKATGIKVRHTSPGRIQEISVGLPPIELQTQFAQIVEKTEALKTQYQQSLQELENLYNTLSQKAFHGELSR